VVTRVETACFENPVKRLGVSGGTAPFFAINLTETGKTRFVPSYGEEDGTISSSYFIGKDLSHAEDEVEFYEKTLVIRDDGNETVAADEGLSDLLDFTFDYAGVVELEEIVGSEAVRRKLLALRNLYDGYEKLRLLDFKIGEKTADANWRGKSRFRAMKQGLLDGFTNSTLQGFRLEGFDGEPGVVTSMDPLLDLKINKSSRLLKSKEKKAARMAFQKMTGSDAIMHFVDVGELPTAAEKLAVSRHYKAGEVETATATDAYSQSELAEIALHETVRQLARLSRTCHRVTVPQKWLGSSVALGFDAGSFPTRSPDAEERIRSKVIVNIFDWGRSELLESSDGLSAEDTEDRKAFWEFYKCGIDNLSFDAARRYYNQFSNNIGWKEITVRVMDYDSTTADDFMGEVTIPLPDPLLDHSPIVEEFVLRNKGKPLVRDGSSGGKRGSVKLIISWWEPPKDESSPRPRVCGAWHVTVERGLNLKRMDVMSSDPYCLVIARSEGFEFEQMTSVVTQSRNPVWGETLEVPVVSSGSELLNSLNGEGLELDSSKVNGLFKDKGDSSHSDDWTKLFV